MKLDLYNTYVHIPIKKYDELKELAEISEEKILQRAKELQYFEEKQDKYSKTIFIRADGEEFMVRVSTYCDFDQQLQPIASKLQWWIEEQIYEIYKSDDPFQVLKRKVKEEQKEKIRYMRSAFFSWLLTIVMAGILILFLIFKQ
ncbi:hypothetical protein ACILE9_11565 [Capnocytophaga cynodegmi]|uniref:hypothetical protein n=1 Tax=Capnocytophaga cynodegmi TaxID=28189 RepID=UPI0037D3A2B6